MYTLTCSCVQIDYISISIRNVHITMQTVD
jgi:hypothetical protein